MANIFAYGSNMCAGRLRDYGVQPSSSCPAKLAGYDLCFDKRSIDGSGKANIIPVTTAGSEIWGVLYEIQNEELDKLDEGEKGYFRTELIVSTNKEAGVKAWIYRAKESFITKGLRPYTWYKRFLVEGATQHGLPEDYINRLKTIQAVDDTNMLRVREKSAFTCA